MGWFWSTTQAPALVPSRTASPQPSPPQRTQPEISQSPTEQSDPAVDELLDFFRAEFTASEKKPPPVPTQARPESSSNPLKRAWSVSEAPPPLSRIGGSQTGQDIHPSTAHTQSKAAAPSTTDDSLVTQRILPPLADSLLPTEISCRQHFDAAYYCNSPGGQFTSVYRYGTVLSCSHHWDAFWFCMRNKGLTGETKERAVRDFNRKREWDKYYAPGKPSSEDVWMEREKVLPKGVAFSSVMDYSEGEERYWREGDEYPE